ncbi:TonB-dependent receptor plug domain-containing protein [Caminibacter sp.]
MKYLIIILAVIVFADTQDFLKTLNEVSEIATNSKLNIDKTPSNVDVINRDFIVKSGAKTLLDVLKYLPSISISMTPSGKKQLVIRGNKSVFRDKIKLLINGVEVTNNLYNNQFYYYNFPASLIKRIEFTKTPDAVLYGGNAFLGVLNVITLNSLDDNELSFYGNTKNYFQISFFKKYNNLLMDGYYSYSYPEIYSPPVYKVNIQTNSKELFRDNVKINSLEKNVGLGLRYKKENDEILFRFNFYKKGNFYGIENIPPLKRDRFVNFYHTYLEFRHSKYIRYNLKNKIKIGIKNYIWDGGFRAFPYDLNSSSHDVIAGAKIPEYEIYLKNILTYNSEKHILNAVFDLKYSKPYNYTYYEYIDGITSSYNLKNVFLKHVCRRSLDVGIEDLYILKDNLSFIVGYRLDNYSDFGMHNSYKFGGVYNLNNNSTFKILYNNAFRVPSWIELYANTLGAFNGNPKLKPETISMWEFIFLKTFKNDKLKTVLYKGLNKNFIGRSLNKETGKLIYQNLGRYDIKGAEISYKKFYKKTILYLSYSINENKAKLSEKPVINYDYQGVRKRWYKGWLEYTFNNRSSFFVSSLYGSKIKLPSSVEIGNYFEINCNYIFNKKNLNITVGVNNLTNHKNYFADFPSDVINDYYFIYADSELPYTGRKIYIRVIKKW